MGPALIYRHGPQYTHVRTATYRRQYEDWFRKPPDAVGLVALVDTPQARLSILRRPAVTGNTVRKSKLDVSRNI